MVHVFLSYQWNSQKLVKQVHDYLTKGCKIQVWMDNQGGIKTTVMECVAKGVQEAAVVVCFCTKDYQKSENCRIELNYAQELGISIIPVICDENYTRRQKAGDIDASKWPCDWLGKAHRQSCVTFCNAKQLLPHKVLFTPRI